MDYRFACRTFMALKFLSRLELEPVQDYPGVVVLADFPKACLDRHAYLHLRLNDYAAAAAQKVQKSDGICAFEATDTGSHPIAERITFWFIWFIEFVWFVELWETLEIRKLMNRNRIEK